MRILLVQPPKAPRTIGGEDVFIYEPLALEYLASAVAMDHDVKILDLRLEKDFERILTEYDPDIVGITAYTVHVNVVKTLCRKVKELKGEALTVVGGHHATVAPDDFLSPSIDIIVMGEGVLPFREIVRRFQKRESLEGVPGTAVPRDGCLIGTKSEELLDLDAFSFPDRKLTVQYRGEYFSEWMKPLASIRTSKGCPFRCTFCAEWKIAGGYYYKRKPERVVDELAEIPEECVFFADDESLIDTGRMARLAQLIREAGIRKRYFLYGRSDTVTRHPRLLEAWRSIGLERVFIGLEFFRDEDLAYVRKSSTVEDNERAVHLLRELGIEVYASFIIRPDFMRSDFEAMRRCCQRMRPDYASFAVLTPLPGTDLYRDVKDTLLTRNLDFYDFIHTVLPTALPLREFYAEVGRLYMKAVPLHMQLASLRKFRVSEIPGLVATGRRFYSRLKTAHLDYAT